jgi:hypothetical protein
MEKSLLQTINYKGRANEETGPRYFAKGLVIEEFYYDMKVLPPDLTIPYMNWVEDQRFRNCKCLFQNKVP